MKLFGLLILYKENDNKVKTLQKEFNLESIGYFQRRYIQEFLVFSAETAVERTAFNIQNSVDLTERIDGVIHIFVRSDGLASVLVSTSDYPSRVAHTLLRKIMNDFTEQYPSTSWRHMPAGSGKMNSLGETLKKYENPQEADPLMKLQNELDETKDIMLITLTNLLKRGENLDDLVEKSDKLSWEAKRFARDTKKLNRCCNLF